MQTNLEATSTIKRLGLNYEIGFMLLDPDSTRASVDESIRFLRKISCDGLTSVIFNKMGALAATPIETRLIEERRLEGSITAPDYRFTDPLLDWYEIFMKVAFSWYAGPDGFARRLREARLDKLIVKRFAGSAMSFEYEEALRALTARVNDDVLRALERGLRVVYDGAEAEIAQRWTVLDEIEAGMRSREKAYARELRDILDLYREPTVV